jgi:hypothetical protein
LQLSEHRIFDRRTEANVGSTPALGLKQGHGERFVTGDGYLRASTTIAVPGGKYSSILWGTKEQYARTMFPGWDEQNNGTKSKLCQSDTPSWGPLSMRNIKLNTSTMQSGNIVETLETLTVMIVIDLHVVETCVRSNCEPVGGKYTGKADWGRKRGGRKSKC